MKEQIKSGVFILSFLLIAVFIIISPLNVSADDVFVEDSGIFSYTTEEKAWQEQDVSLPEYPDEENLLLLRLADNQFKYYIDSTSISVGAEDQVVRYSIVIVSTSGVRNALYAGIRCDGKGSKTYAFGTGSGPFREMSSRWKLLSNSGSYRYQFELYNNYFCKGGAVPEKAQNIIEELRDTL